MAYLRSVLESVFPPPDAVSQFGPPSFQKYQGCLTVMVLTLGYLKLRDPSTDLTVVSMVGGICILREILQQSTLVANGFWNETLLEVWDWGVYFGWLSAFTLIPAFVAVKTAYEHCPKTVPKITLPGVELPLDASSQHVLKLTLWSVFNCCAFASGALLKSSAFIVYLILVFAGILLIIKFGNDANAAATKTAAHNAAPAQKGVPAIYATTHQRNGAFRFFNRHLAKDGKYKGLTFEQFTADCKGKGETLGNAQLDICKKLLQDAGIKVDDHRPKH